MRGADEDWDSGDERPEDEQWIDVEQLSLQEELGRGAFGVGKFHFPPNFGFPLLFNLIISAY